MKESFERRMKLAEDKIARAETEALREVREAAIDAATAAARTVIAEKLTPEAAETTRPGVTEPLTFVTHASHFRYALPGSGEACLIEPAVTCNHCGYCQSHGL